jgi:hypothetical protein
VLQLCSHPVIDWPDAPPGVLGLWFIQVGQFEEDVILLAVGWYLRFSYRDVEELRAERGLRANQVTVGKREAQVPGDQRQLAGRRDVLPGQRQMGLLVPGRGWGVRS